MSESATSGVTERERACAAKREGERCEVGAEEHICARHGVTLSCLPATSMEVDMARLHARHIGVRDVAIGAGAVGMLAATICACARYSTTDRLRWARTTPLFVAAWLAFCLALVGSLVATTMPSAFVGGPARVVYRTNSASEATGCALSFESRVRDLERESMLVEFMSAGEDDRSPVLAAIRLSWRKWRVIAMDPDNLEIDWQLGPCFLRLDVVDDRVLISTPAGVGILNSAATTIGAWRYRDDEGIAWLLDRERFVARTEGSRSVMVLIDRGEIIDPAVAPVPLRDDRARWIWDGPVGSTVGVDFVMRYPEKVLQATRDGREMWRRPANAALFARKRLYLCSASFPVCERVDPETGQTLARAPWELIATDGGLRHP